jgi:hypothetical protein
MNKTQVTWVVGTIAALIAIGSGAKTFWRDFGWITPAQAEVSHQAAEGAIKDFRDEWKCDEYEEELRELRRELSRTDEGTDEYADLEHEIRRIENKMDKTDCSRFEDFG